ncbi:unnamed protein product [Polarella glacialis]|uniref:U-box domain-containing protein n=1 Tax=Polarella glacialis TaxID=89957 RepID=A0A813DEA1_POLGL|nr:unnamed protein product [Polarella glacialis]
MICQNHVPAEFLCPITREMMADPAILADGRSDERSALMKWLETSEGSPMTGEVMPHTIEIPNVNLRALIEDWSDSETVNAAIREEETALQEMPRDEQTALRAQVQAAFRQEDGLVLIVESVRQVYQQDLARKFTNKQAELTASRGACPVVTRYHGTTKEAAAAIARDGFRLPEADGDGDFVGAGLRVFYTEEQRVHGLGEGNALCARCHCFVPVRLGQDFGQRLGPDQHDWCKASSRVPAKQSF